MDGFKPTPVWREIPYILAVVFPDDDEVHEVIWENFDPAQPGGTLNALTLGGFATLRATELRIHVLFAKPEDFLSHFSTSAARVLGRCQSSEGLKALVQRLETLDEIHLTSFVVEAIVAYGTDALTYQDELP